MTDLRKQKKDAAKALDIKVPCAVCKVQEPLATAHDHHRTPRAFGGTDDEANRIWLCASCHTRLHRVQEFLVQGKAASAYDLARSIFPTNDGARGELWTLANEAAEAEQEVKEAFGLHKTHVKVTLSIESDAWAALKDAAKAQKRSAKDLAAEILLQAVKRL